MVIVLAIISSMIGISVAKIGQASMSATTSNKIALQASNIAASDAALLHSVSYEDLTVSNRNTVPDTDFQHETLLSSESNYTDSIKQRTATINVYKGSETTPRASLKVTRYSVEKQESSGVPIGTVIAWPGSKAPTTAGTWLECNGQSCAAYPELVAVLGKNTVPDYRGVFLRGYGSVTSSHFNTITHKSADLGVLQGDSIRNLPVSSFYAAIGKVGSNFASEDQQNLFSCSGAFSFSSFYNTAMKVGDSDNWGRKYTLDFSRSLPVSNEIRPINRSVRYFIKSA